MQKIVAIGDIHGYPTWKEVVKQTEFDKFIFVGDYFDSYKRWTAAEQIANFNEIVQFKLDNFDKVVMLFGNHDYHYLRSTTETYSGFQKLHRVDISDAIHNAIDKDCIRMCHVHDDYLFSHAGVTKTWCNYQNIDPTDLDNIEENINDLFKYKPNSFKFTVGINFDEYGDDICQSPIWVRPRSLFKDRIDRYTQVVGHTTMRMIAPIDRLVIIDTLGTSREFAVIENGTLQAVTLKD